MEARPASTVALLRDSPAGVETLMLVRPVRAEFAASAQVFPGGRIDDEDAAPAWEALTGCSAAQAAAQLGTEHETGAPPALALLVGAVREVFEETAILLGGGSEMVDAATLRAARDRLHRGDTTFAALAAETPLAVDVSGLVYFARWITPEIGTRRYDTRFFAARVPPGREASAAPGEVESLEWITPEEALRRADAGTAFTMPPTRVALEALRGTDVESVLARLASEADLAPILPVIRRMPTPGDPGSLRVEIPGRPGTVPGS